MNKDWITRFEAAIARSSPEQEEEFLLLADEAEGNCTIDVARVLLKSFLAKEDFGTQERVVSVLATADKIDAITAILEELPRLMRETPDWAEILVGQEVDRRPELLSTIARTTSPLVRIALNELLCDSDFEKSYPNAQEVLRGM